MFKYISDILKQFSPSQKILALVIVITSITIISIFPSLIESITISDKECSAVLKTKNSEIKNLNSQIDSLNNVIRKHDRACTNEIATRETEFIAMLNDLKSDIKTPGRADRRHIAQDTLMLTTSMEVSSIRKPVDVNKKIIDKIEWIKRKVKK